MGGGWGGRRASEVGHQWRSMGMTPRAWWWRATAGPPLPATTTGGKSSASTRSSSPRCQGRARCGTASRQCKRLPQWSSQAGRRAAAATGLRREGRVRVCERVILLRRTAAATGGAASGGGRKRDGGAGGGGHRGSVRQSRAALALASTLARPHPHERRAERHVAVEKAEVLVRALVVAIRPLLLAARGGDDRNAVERFLDKRRTHGREVG